MTKVAVGLREKFKDDDGEYRERVATTISKPDAAMKERFVERKQRGWRASKQEWFREEAQ